jgi:hypothetical protein
LNHRAIYFELFHMQLDAAATASVNHCG